MGHKSLLVDTYFWPGQAKPTVTFISQSGDGAALAVAQVHLHMHGRSSSGHDERPTSRVPNLGAVDGLELPPEDRDGVYR